ncbi:MAG: hypothetical protein Q8P88_01540 [Candidatus Jorgensenbacteria bacterium]|nr:hypothetical protein [Candidatus Jorgensenbacteria bacterium]
MPFTRSLIALILIATLGANFLLSPIVSAQTAGDAVKQCTVNAVLDSIGGAVLNTIGDVAKGIVSGVADFFGLEGVVDSGPQEVKEVGEQGKEIKKLQFDTCVNAIKEQAFKIALAKLKKRLLDRVVDDIIGWISDGRDPKFITNFGDYLEDAGQAAVGDTARALGLAELCTPFKYRIPSLLTPIPKFSQAVSCTLDDIVENIEGFYENFENGGWLAYAELWKPQNNPHGVLLATQDELLKQASKKQKEAQLAAVSSGLKPIEQCLEWTLVGTKRGDGKPFVSYIPTGDSFPYFHPYFPPGPGSQPYENAANTLINPEFVCPSDRRQITLPPAFTQEYVKVAVTADTQVIANSDDLSPYINAIFDAAVNRIIKEGVKGLRGNPSNLRSESATRRAPQQYSDDDPYRDYGDEYRNATNFTVQLRAELQTQLTQAQNDILVASTTRARLVVVNQVLIASTTALVNCESTRLGVVCSSSSSTLSLAKSLGTRLANNQTNIEGARRGIEEIRTALNANVNLAEGELRALLATVSSVRNSLQTVLVQFKELEISLNRASEESAQKLQACQTSTYQCSAP